MNNKVIIIYHSMYNGNTKKIADRMGNTLHCNVVDTEGAKKLDLTNYEYVGLGSGIFYGSHHPDLMQIVDRLHKNQKSFIFSTHGAPYVGKYHKPILTKLSDKGVTVIGEFSCKGYDCTGPYNLYYGGNKGKPNERDMLKAQRYVEKLLPQYATKVTVPKGKHVWIEQSSCVNCGTCVRVCPMQVLEVIDKRIHIVKEDDCVHCNLCTQKCTEGAIAVTHSRRELIAIAKNNAWRKSL